MTLYEILAFIGLAVFVYLLAYALRAYINKNKESNKEPYNAFEDLQRKIDEAKERREKEE